MPDAQEEQTEGEDSSGLVHFSVESWVQNVQNILSVQAQLVPTRLSNQIRKVVSSTDDQFRDKELITVKLELLQVK